MKPARSWFLLDAPADGTRFERWLHVLHGRGEGLVIRSGPGLDPLLLASPIHAAGFRFALSINLRDRNAVALTSVLQSARWLNIPIIFLGDPPPFPSANPMSGFTIPDFIRFARGITGNAVRYGVYNPLAQPHDEDRLLTEIDAGAQVLALPESGLHRFTRGGLETWHWHRLHPQARPPQNDPTVTMLSDLTAIPESAVEATLKDWHERHER